MYEVICTVEQFIVKLNIYDTVCSDTIDPFVSEQLYLVDSLYRFLNQHGVSHKGIVNNTRDQGQYIKDYKRHWLLWPVDPKGQ